MKKLLITLVFASGLASACLPVLAMSGFAGNTDLHNAINDYNTASVKELIDSGADVMAQNNAGDTPLHFAARLDDIPENRANVSLLLAQRADQLLSQQNNAGQTPVQVAKTPAFGAYLKTHLSK